MPKCVKCMKMYHPDWCIEQTIRDDDVIVCKFCRVDKNELTVEDENGNLTEIVTKDQASMDYLKYLEGLSKKPEIAKILSESKNEVS